MATPSIRRSNRFASTAEAFAAGFRLNSLVRRVTEPWRIYRRKWRVVLVTNLEK